MEINIFITVTFMIAVTFSFGQLQSLVFPFKMLLVLVLAVKIFFSEARVFCQDDNALNWKPLGYACTITCSTIVTAVDKLKLRDYQYIINDEDRKRMNLSEADLYMLGQKLQDNVFYSRKSNSLTPDMRRHIKLYQTYHRLLTNEHFENALKKEAGKMTAELNNTCWNSKMASKDVQKKVVNVKCTRRLNKRPEVLEKFTKFLNQFADPKYPFDEEMAGAILQKLEGNLNLRYGIVDYKRILAYLRKALKYHRSQGNELIIRLQSKHCITLHQPGCFCKIGYVEDKGQCVKPEDCIPNSVFTEYLERIILY